MSKSSSKGSGKERPAKSTPMPNQTKNEGLSNNIKATPEQIRLAQITSGDDNQEKRTEEKIKELAEMTSKSQEECALALHDCNDEMDKAALLLLEGTGEPGEWKMGGKRKKRQSTQPHPSKPDIVDHLNETPDSSRDRSRDKEAGDRGDREFPPRRGRRSNGGSIPRLSRGRGRDRGNMGDRLAEDGDERENGVGVARNGDRGRGRGRGGQSRRGRGGGARTFRGGQGQRFEKEPHIDTWTNETAENASKVPVGWGETWTDDLADDSWSGSLNETKVFTASATKTEETTDTTPPAIETPSIGQRLDLGRLLPKLNNDSTNSENYIAQYNAQATESIKNSIGIGSDSSRQHYSHQGSSVQSMMNMSSNSMATASQANSWASTTAAAVGMPTSTPSQQSVHRPKPLKSKLPPPSKIPQSAVEMPGNENAPPLDIHFGLDDGDANTFDFTVGDEVGANSFSTSSANSTTISSSNHATDAAAISAPMISTASSQPATALEQAPRSAFQSTGYSKKEGQSTLAASSRMSPSADMSYSQSEQKPAQRLPAHLPSQTSSHSQGPASSANEGASSLASYAQSTSSYSMANYKSIASTQSYSSTHTTNSQVGSYQSQFPSSPKTYSGQSQSQYQSGPSQYQSSQGQQSSQYPASQYPTGQTQYQGYQSSSVGSYQSNNTSSLYQNPPTPASSFQQASASYHTRDSQAGSGQPSSGYQGQGAGLASPTSQAQSSYGGPAFTSANHQPSLSSSSMTSNKLGDSMSKMSLKESAMDSHSNAQFEHSATSTTSAGVTTSTGALATGTTTVAAATVSPAATNNSSRGSSNLSSSASTKAPPNLPPGVPLTGMGATPGQFYMGTHPAIYGVQPQVYGYDEMMHPGRIQMANSYYDLAQFQVPTTLAGRDTSGLTNVPYSGSADSSKLARVEAQSPNPTSQSGHNPPQQPNFLPFVYYPPQLMPSAAPGFPQYPQLYQMPPVTNTPHAGTTGSSQYQKNYGYSNKGYDDQTQGQDFSKTGYGGSQSQSKGSLGGRSGGSGELAATAYGKTHPQQAFDKQGFHGNTPPPFNMPPLAAANQATPMGAPNNAYPFMPVMTHQPHSQMLHHQMPDSTTGSNRVGGGQGSNMGKAKAYGGYWNN